MRKRYLAGMATVAALSLSGCVSSSLSYVPPTRGLQPPTSKEIPRSRDSVWDAAVPVLGADFFVINNIDRSSGLINLSYSGDPTRFVDCGQIHAGFTDASGKYENNFPGSAPLATYKQKNTVAPLAPPVAVRRQMKLDGRANIIFQKEGEDKTKVTVNVRYIVTRDLSAIFPNGFTQHATDTASFGSREQGAMPGNPEDVICQSNGQFEKTVLDMIN